MISTPLSSGITKREKEILLLILEEHSSQSIADRLQLSIRTVETHRKHILKKTATKTLVGLLKYAIAAELIPGFYHQTGVKKT
ncbi:MAG: helix-turn-helix transcriptional regulator [Bacteroidetes bacterium]|nr:helix-turn-helix transcriptional regulator [Bacteroidota bacterium]